jgi:hypothetical protein
MTLCMAFIGLEYKLPDSFEQAHIARGQMVEWPSLVFNTRRFGASHEIKSITMRSCSGSELS